MELPPDNLSGMTSAAAREYIAAHIETKILNEKKLAELEKTIAKWKDRADLARRTGAADLAEAAEAEAARAAADRDKIASETRELEVQIDSMRRQLPTLAARQRSVDPDLLEQELRIAAGGTPGDDEEAAAAEAARKIAQLEKHAAADEQLAALKARLAAERGADSK